MPAPSPSERHRRIRFIKRLLRPLPRRTNVHRYPVLKWFGTAARKRAYLWSFRTNAMTPAFYVGALLSLQPIIGVQIPLAFAAALILRANLPAMVGLQLITNVFTAAPVYALTYQVGTFVMEKLDISGPAVRGGPAATKLVIGGIICGLALGFVLDVIYRFFAYEAGKHHWHLPRRNREVAKESASPAESRGQKD
jgi:uncharacterized protein (DUF2062 family)